VLSQKCAATSEKGEGLHCMQKLSTNAREESDREVSRASPGCHLPSLGQLCHQGATPELPHLHPHCEGSRLLRDMPGVGSKGEASTLWLWSPVP